MDTSTLIITDSPDTDSKYPALTSVLHSDSIQPGVEWFTRLISPLTKHTTSIIKVATTTNSIVQPSQKPVNQVLEPTERKVMALAAAIAREGSRGEMKVDAVGSVPARIGAGADINLDVIGGGSSSGGSGLDDQGMNTVLLILIPMLAVVLTVLLGLVVFLIAMLYMRRKRGIRLTEDGGPLDLSKGDGVIGEGGVEGVESRWLETVEPDVREAYRRTKDWQSSYPPASSPTDITLSQFLSIQEKGVSAWAFEPDYEDNLSLYVQSRTEITFLSDGPGMPAREGGGNSVMANLPLPKLNEVYYWEVKVYEKPSPSTEIAIGLATKPYPSFRLPGWAKISVAYFASDGFKSHNYPFTASSHGAPLAEGDVLGVGYKPRTGTVFFTRNGRKMDDAYTGLQRFNLFPTVGANGPCTLHINLGQAGFVFIEANVKKWGLAPITGTLAPPPAYGSEGGSILLDAGYGTPNSNTGGSHLSGVGALLEAARNNGRIIPSPTATPRSSNSSRRHRRAGKSTTLTTGSIPAIPSPLRASEAGPSRRRTSRTENNGLRINYRSPTDTPYITPRVPSPDALDNLDDDDDDAEILTDEQTRLIDGYSTSSRNGSRDEDGDGDSSVPDSPLENNPPTPNLLDISLHSLHRRPEHNFGGRRQGVEVSDEEEEIRSDVWNTPLISRSSRRGEGGSIRNRNTGTGGGDSGGSRSGSGSGESEETIRPLGPPRDSPPPPGYAPLDPHVYSTGLPMDLPEELVNRAIADMPDSQAAHNARLVNAMMDPPSNNRSTGGGALSWFRRG